MGTDDARRKTQVVAVGNVAIGGGAPISVQSMCNTKTTDVAATLSHFLCILRK
jgi:(E)-4-hydroxy-3-methylbut-2-enyl-diphosphate synthase